MTFRGRLTTSAAVAVGVAVAVVSVVVWFLVRSQLRAEVDDDLRRRATVASRIQVLIQGDRIAVPPPVLGERVAYFQVVTPDGDVIRSGAGPRFEVPIPGEVPLLEDRTVRGTHYRVISQEIAGGAVLSLALPLTDVDESLRRLALILFVVAGGGIALAVVLGRGVATAAAAPLARLTEAAERVRATGDLSHRIRASSADDELGRLASSFNAMLGALETSVGAQRQLVADASHELRTPITSIRTNLEVLASGAQLDPGERERLLEDVRVQLEELTALVNDLVELARGVEPGASVADVRLDEVVEEVVESFRRHAGAVSIATDLEPAVVRGDASRIARAVRNLVDNAVKWSAPDGVVEVAVGGSAVVVRDHGPGFDAGDLPHVFDRFYRATGARSKPGSGLGLAIVRQIADAMGGRAVASNAPDGGAVVRLELPPAGATLPAPPL